MNLLKKGVIPTDDKELYEYGLFMFLSYIMFFLFSLILGFLFKVPLESIIFFVAFGLIRSFAGGVHADTEMKCTVFTSFSLLFSVILIRLLINYNAIAIVIILVIVSATVLFLLKPVTYTSKEINEDDKLYYKKIVNILTIILIVIVILSAIFKLYNITFSTSVGLTLATVLLIIGKIQRSKQ